MHADGGGGNAHRRQAAGVLGGAGGKAAAAVCLRELCQSRDYPAPWRGLAPAENIMASSEEECVAHMAKCNAFAAAGASQLFFSARGAARHQRGAGDLKSTDTKGLQF